MALVLCPHCRQSCEEALLQPFEGRGVCPECGEQLRKKQFATQVADLREIQNRYPKPPRRVTAAVRAAYLRENSFQRLWLYCIGVVSLLGIPSLRYLSERYELREYDGWYRRMAYLSDPSESGRPPQDPASQRKVSIQYYPGVDVLYQEHPEAGIHDTPPAPRGLRGTRPISKLVLLSAEEEDAARSYLRDHQGYTYVDLSPTEETRFVGQWEHGGAGLAGRLAQIRERNAGLGWSLGLMAGLGWASALLHRWRMLRKVALYREGVLVLATESTRLTFFQSELFDVAMDFSALAKAWAILKLHINVVYLVRIPKHPNLLVLQLSKRTQPWYVDGRLVVCHLPGNPGAAVLVPSELGVRMALGG